MAANTSKKQRIILQPLAVIVIFVLIVFMPGAFFVYLKINGNGIPPVFTDFHLLSTINRGIDVIFTGFTKHGYFVSVLVFAAGIFFFLRLSFIKALMLSCLLWLIGFFAVALLMINFPEEKPKSIFFTFNSNSNRPLSKQLLDENHQHGLLLLYNTSSEYLVITRDTEDNSGRSYYRINEDQVISFTTQQ